MCASFSGMYPMRARISSGAFATSSPSTVICPWSGRDEPEQALDHRALAGAIRAEQADGARREGRRHVAKRVAAVAHRNTRQAHDHIAGTRVAWLQGRMARTAVSDMRCFHYTRRTRRPFRPAVTAASGCRAAAAAASSQALEPELVCALTHEADDIADVLPERKPELLGAAPRSSRLTARAKASFIRLTTDDASRSMMLFVGRTSAAAVTNPDISSHAYNVCSRRDSRGTLCSPRARELRA